jgi:hypothetical protein
VFEVDGLDAQAPIKQVPRTLPQQKAEVAIPSGVVGDFEIVKDNDSSGNEDKNNIEEEGMDSNKASSNDERKIEEGKDSDKDSTDDEENIEEEEGDPSNKDYGLTKHGTVCKSCVKAQGRCRLHKLK